MKYLLAFILLYFTSNIELYSQDNKDKETYNIESKIESWYIMFGFSLANNSYTIGKLNDVIDDNKNNSGLSKSVDVLGIYLPLNNKTLLGAFLNMSSDPQSDEIWFRSISLGLSTQYYLNYIGKGIFFRVDLGYSGLVPEGKWKSDELDLYKLESVYEGVSILAGVGYGIEIFSDTRINFVVNLSHRFLNEGTNSSINYGISFLF